MFIAVDIGGTSCRVLGSSTLEDILFTKKKQFNLLHSFEKDFNHLIDIIAQLSQDTNITAIGEDCGLFGALALLKNKLAQS